MNVEQISVSEQVLRVTERESQLVYVSTKRQTKRLRGGNVEEFSVSEQKDKQTDRETDGKDKVELIKRMKNYFGNFQRMPSLRYWVEV